MSFCSFIFIFAFFPICLILYFLINKLQNKNLGLIFLIFVSFIFYSFMNSKLIIFLLLNIIINFILYKSISNNENKKIKLCLLIVSLLINIGFLVYCKYYNFFIENLNIIFHKDFVFKNIIFPLGISYITFSQLAVLIDSYKNKIENKYNFINYAAYISYFPKILQGPIALHFDIIPQFLDNTKKCFSWDNFAKGLYAFTLGLSKKIIIADTLGKLVNAGFNKGIEDVTPWGLILITIMFTLQLFYDFSGYSDMAIGVSKMFNIDIKPNFLSPLKAITIKDFWKRWHISLTQFLTKYLYIPLGGNRCGKFRTYINTMIVFLVCGFWHGANYTFILWGFLHGLFLIIYKNFENFFLKIPKFINWIITFIFVCSAFLLFKTANITQTLYLFKKMLSINSFDLDSFFAFIFSYNPFTFTFFDLYFVDLHLQYTIIPYCLLYSFIIASLLLLKLKNVYELMNEFKPSIKNCLLISLLLAYCIMSFNDIKEFIYMNF